MNAPHTIGITGGIGSGKSYVARLLQHTFALPLYDSDARARELMTTSSELRRQLTDLIGEDIYAADGTLNRRRVADFLFHSADNAAAVNAIVHPVVRHDWLCFAAQSPGTVLLESALLIEADMADTVDAIVVVTAPERLRLQRAMARDGATEQQVRERMARQMPEAELITYADHVVINDGRPLLPQLMPVFHV